MIVVAPVLWVDDSRAPELATALVPELALRLPELQPTRLAGSVPAARDPVLEVVELSRPTAQRDERLEVQLRLFVREDELVLAETLSVPLPIAMSARHVAVRVETALRLAPLRVNAEPTVSQDATGDTAATVVAAAEAGASGAGERDAWALLGLIEAQTHVATGESTVGLALGVERRRGPLVARVELDGRWPMAVRETAPTIRVTEGALALVAGATQAFGPWWGGMGLGPGLELVHAAARPGADNGTTDSRWRALVRGELWLAHGAGQAVSPLVAVTLDWTPANVRHRWQGRTAFESGPFELRIGLGVTGDLRAR